MRKLYKSSMLVAVAAMAFAGCTKDNTEGISEVAGNKITVSANAYAPETDTRTVIGDKNEQGKYPVYWSDENEALAIVEFADNTRAAAIKTGEYTLSGDKKSANFQFELTENPSATTFDYYALYPYSVWSEDISTTKEYISFRFPATQTPGATSVDPDASVLFAKNTGLGTQPTTLDFSFQHLAAYAKMTLTGLSAGGGSDEVVKSVTFSSPDKALAGTYKYVHGAPETSTISGTSYNSITANVEGLTGSTSQDLTVWFACLPTTINDTFSVSVQTDANTYTREVTVQSEKPLEFVAGQVSTFVVDMSSATSIEDYSGEYVILVNQNETYYALSSKSSTKNKLDAVVLNYNGSDESITTGDADLVWTVAKSGSSYTFSNNGQYICWPTSGNDAGMSEDEYLLDITDNNNGTFAITANKNSSRKLQKNNSQQYFAFYTSNQTGDIYLVPATYVVLPAISADETEISLEYNDETSHEFNVTVSDATSVSAAAYDDAEGVTQCSWLTAKYTEGKVTYNATTNSTDAERSAYIIITATNENGSRKAAILVRQQTNNANALTVTFDFSSNVDGWPVKSSASNDNYTYNVDGTDYVFALTSKIYCNSSYLMLNYTTALGLPAVENYKLTKVVGTLNGNGSPSLASKVSICSDTTGTVVTGGETQTWSVKGGETTYNLSGTTANTVYYMYITNKNLQMTKLVLTYTAE